MSEIKIIKASAGSGKTYRLTEEYLKILFQNEINYRHILAATFTNKATEEMKTRIVEEINVLAKNKNSNHKESLLSFLKISETELQQKAENILHNLLHDYSRFSVGTIDSFFQRILRGFSKELGLQTGFNVDLDTDTAINSAIDKLLIDIETDKILRKWLVKFAEENINNGKNWNIEKDIEGLAKQIFSEKFKSLDKEFISKINDKKFLSKYMSELQSIIKSFENELKEIGKDAIEIMQKYNLDIKDFSNGKGGIANFFNKIQEGNKNSKNYEIGVRVNAGIGNVDKWHTKTSKRKDDIIAACNSGLLELLSKATDFIHNNIRNYFTAKEIFKNMYILGILSDLSTKVLEYSNEKNIFLITETNNFLKDIIDNNDAPFIYEKVGSIYKYFMIDEFQDTSSLQWSNFKSLIDNSLSLGHNNLVVGDIKQSIYRWRNSDWKILAEQVEDNYKYFNVKNINLENNWRSKKYVIDFNNTIFKYLPNVLQSEFNSKIINSDLSKEFINDVQNKITNAYNTSFQIYPKKNNENNGYIKNQFIDSELEWKDIILEQVPKTVEELQEQNYKLKDIAILTRTKSEAKLIVDTFIKYKNSNEAKANLKYDIISNEALYISSSNAVKLIINILQFLNSPTEILYKSLILNYLHNLQNPQSTIHSDIANLKIDKDNSIFLSNMPKEFAKKYENIQRLPLFEITENIIDIFDLKSQKSEINHLQGFQDLVMNFANKEIADINSFLQWWNTNGVKESLNLSDQQDAIRLITIHKSKGLEFKAVIIPFFDWKANKNAKLTDIMWCSPKSAPFNQLNSVPIKFSNSLENTIFEQDFRNEELHSYIDNINVTYVAFTRAVNALYTFSPSPKKTKSGLKIERICDFLFLDYNNEITKENNEFLELNSFWNKETMCLEIGNLKKIATTENTDTNIVVDEYITNNYNEKLKIKLYGTDFFNEENNNTQINYGRIIHNIFENIITKNDINNAIVKFENKGEINSNEAKIIKQKIEILVDSENVKDWFDEKWEIKTEVDILLSNGDIKRPDRVVIKDDEVIVIDYKSGKENKKDKKQVLEYIQILEKMDYKNVSGYLWYLSDNKIVNC